jgi:acetyl esterase
LQRFFLFRSKARRLCLLLVAMIAVGLPVGCSVLAQKERELVFRIEPGNAAWFSGLPRGVEELQLTHSTFGNQQNIHAWWWPAARADAPALLYLHGGGFVVGGLETHDSLCRQLARRSGGARVALDYRLAPEHPFPAAVDATWAARGGLLEQATALGLDPARLAIGGDSAGGTLAAVGAIHARDRGWPLVLQLLVTPGTTAHADTPSHRLFAQGFLIDAPTIACVFDHCCAAHHRRDWRFAPLEATDLDGVAPACVVLAECDPLVDEGIAYADRLRAAGVPVQLELARGVTHDFIKMGRVLKEAGQAQQAAADALKEAWT